MSSSDAFPSHTSNNGSHQEDESAASSASIHESYRMDDSDSDGEDKAADVSVDPMYLEELNEVCCFCFSTAFLVSIPILISIFD